MSTQQNDQTSALDAAVSAIYFDDNSDYERALYTVIRHLSPRVWSVIQTDKSAAFKAVRAMVERAERATENKEEDRAELAYWRFDARVKGYSEWKGRPQSERDAFKAEYRGAEAISASMLTELAESLREVVRISDRQHDAWDRAKSALQAFDATNGGPVCSYPDCNCPFDAPADPDWCARGFRHEKKGVR